MILYVNVYYMNGNRLKRIRMYRVKINNLLTQSINELIDTTRYQELLISTRDKVDMIRSVITSFHVLLILFGASIFRLNH